MTFTPVPTTIEAAVADLRSRVTGEVLIPTDAGYDAARAAWNVAVQQHPAVVVVAASQPDVVEAVRFARATGLRVAVQATGHGVARPADGAVLILTARLDAVTIDPTARTAYVAAGAKWAAVLGPAQEHGLAPLLGSSPGVGAIGYTLGGGMGWLGRHHGLASDSVRAFDIVTPDGIEVRATADEQPELFFALKGGGGGTLGVVTGMEIELYPVSTVYAGNLLYPAPMARAVLQRWREWIRSVGEEMTSSVCLMNFPPLDDVPEPLRGQSFAMVRGCWSGRDLAAGKALIDEWRQWSPPAIDMFGPLPFVEIATVSNDPVDPMPGAVTTELFDSLPDEAIDVIVQASFATAGPPPLVFSEIRHAGGAIARLAPRAANDRARQSEMVLELLAVVPDPVAALEAEAHLRRTRGALARFVTGGAYLNFLDGREKQERTAQAFSTGHLDRVQAVKAAVDADDRFCHGFGIPPR